MSLDTIMNLSISVESRAPTQEGFGTPLLFGFHTAWLDRRVAEYATADEMLDDGFTTDHYLYKAARIVKSQDPSPGTFKIGRRVTPLTQKIEITPTVVTEGFKYKGTIGGKAVSYTVLAGATATTIAAALASLINSLAAGVAAATVSSASALGSVAGPWDIEPGDTLKVAIDANSPASPTTVTFTGTQAARESTNSEATPFALADGDALTVKIDDGFVQTITFHTASFVDITHATAEEIAAVINASLIGANATATSGGTKVTITSDRRGSGSHVEVTGGTANAAGKLNFATAVANGTGNVADIDSVTFAEVQAAIQGAVAGCAVTNDAGRVRITSNSSGPSSKVLIDVTSSADAIFGFDNAEHTGTSGGSTITCTASSPGTVVDYDMQGGMQLKDVTVDTTTDDELPAIANEDSDWYGLVVCDSSAKATALNAAAWIESQRKIQAFQTSDTEVLDNNVSDDVMSELQASSYARTHAVYHRALGGVEWLGLGWMASYLTTTPGEATAAFKEVKGVKMDVLLQGQENAIGKKNGSFYTKVAGLGLTFEGKSGSGEFIDTVRFIDFIYARMRERVVGTLANVKKIPYTDAGVDLLRSAILAVIKLGIGTGGFADTPEPTVTAPAVKDVDPALRINRILPDLKWSAHLAGAIHRLNPVKGTVSV